MNEKSNAVPIGFCKNCIFMEKLKIDKQKVTYICSKGNLDKDLLINSCKDFEHK